MARKKNQNPNITFDDLAKLGPKKIILLIIAAIAIYFSGGDFSFLGNVGNETNVNVNVNSSEFFQGIVARVIDGDTAVIRVNGEDRRVRFLGVDTPETVHPSKGVQPYGREASNFTKESLQGRDVWLEYDRAPTDRYNRHLAYIWLKRPSQITRETIRKDMFNARLLAGGYAKVMIIKPNNKYADFFNELQTEAKKSKLGMWK